MKLNPFKSLSLILNKLSLGIVGVAISLWMQASAVAASPQVFRSVQMFGNKILVSTVKLKISDPEKFITSTSVENVEGPHGEWSICRVISAVEIGTVDASFRVVDLAETTQEERAIEEQALFLNLMRDDASDPNCLTSHTVAFSGTASSGFLINEFFGNRFGRPESSLQVALEISLKNVSVAVNGKGLLSAQLSTEQLYGLKISGITAFYYVGAGDISQLPTLKSEESPKLQFQEVPTSMAY